MKSLIRILSAAALVSLAASCGPSRYTVPVEMRHPSKSGIDLSGKTVSMVYLDNGNSASSAVGEAFAGGFADALEEAYGTGEGSVGVYKIETKPDAAYASKDSLFNILMDTGADLVFLLDTVTFINQGNMQYAVKLYCFDGMDKTEKVHLFEGKFSTPSSDAWNTGNGVADSFAPQWKTEQYSVFYFDNDKWYEPLSKAIACDWSAALDAWLTLTDSRDMLKRSCAAYNISVACCLIGDYDLALKWLDRSDEENKLPQSDSMRKRITSYMKSARR